MRPGGKLRESEEYQMGRSGRGMLSIQSSEDGSPCLCRLRTDRLALVSKFDYVLSHTGYMESRKLNNFMCHRIGQYLTSLHGCTMG
jgi:hypothetical protein